jgi:hypothetical protein
MPTPPHCALPESWMLEPSLCLFEWQTLIAGLLAVLAAAVSVWFLRKQISQTEALHQAALRRRFNAARATLPLTLSGLCAYATALVGELSARRRARSPSNVNGSREPLLTPAPPTELVVSLQQMIEATEQKNVVALLSEIIGEIQVLTARVSGLTHYQTIRSVDTYIIQGAGIHALASSLFDFARREVESGPISVNWESVVNALRAMNIHDSQFPELFVEMERRRARKDNYWQFAHD